MVRVGAVAELNRRRLLAYVEGLATVIGRQGSGRVRCATIARG